MKAKRLQEMENFLLHQGFATMEELKTRFGVSMNTVRRDAALLVSSGTAEKVYGGLKAAKNSSVLVPYENRLQSMSSVKHDICARASRIIKDGDIIFIDSGTTTVHLIDLLRDRNVTVITNNVEVEMRAMDLPNIRLIMVPGELHRKTRSITGEESARFLSVYNTNYAFMAATGISQAGGVTNSSPREFEIKREAVSHTECAVLLVTGQKFGITSLLTYAPLDRFHTVITDKSAPPQWVERMEAQGIDVQIADGEPGQEISGS